MKIAILGAGKMGSWLARELVRDHDVAVHDPDPAKAPSAGPAAWLPSLDGLGEFRPEMVLNAVSLQATIPAFRDASPWLNAGCFLADVASIKGDLPAFYAGCGHPFVSVHPMFGPTFADLSGLRGESAVVISGSNEDGARLFRALFDRLGIRIFEIPFAEHDRMMAYSLSVPFVASTPPRSRARRSPAIWASPEDSWPKTTTSWPRSCSIRTPCPSSTR